MTIYHNYNPHTRTRAILIQHGYILIYCSQVTPKTKTNEEGQSHSQEHTIEKEECEPSSCGLRTNELSQPATSREGDVDVDGIKASRRCGISSFTRAASAEEKCHEKHSPIGVMNNKNNNYDDKAIAVYTMRRSQRTLVRVFSTFWQ
jgi:hypothetical protein